MSRLEKHVTTYSLYRHHEELVLKNTLQKSQNLRITAHRSPFEIVLQLVEKNTHVLVTRSSAAVARHVTQRQSILHWLTGTQPITWPFVASHVAADSGCSIAVCRRR